MEQPAQNLPQTNRVRHLAYNYQVVAPRENHEYIAMSAVYFDDKQKHPNQPKNIETGYVVGGLRHHNCWSTKHLLTGLGPSEIRLFSGEIVNISIEANYSKPVQGFITSKNIFLGRAQSAEIAYLAGQIPDWEPGDSLASEELY